MDYKQKYIKYKQKYLRLKGGAGTMYLPCEITNDVKKIYLELDIVKLLKIDDLFKNIYRSEDSDMINVDFDSSAIYKQDKIIFLKHNEQDYAIIISNNTLFIDYIIKENVNEAYMSENGNDLGGNFISSPCSPKNPHGLIFCFNQITPKLSKFLNDNLLQKLIQLECSFRYNNERHIDECMCFMPYKDHYKVWIYYIRNINLFEEIIDIDTIEKIKKILDEERLRNLNCISDELYGSNYDSNREKFVEFPIDLEIINKKNFKITNIPIFNRLWYEKDDQCRAIFSIGESIDPEVQTILDKELPFIGSIIDQTRNFKCEFINTTIYHNKDFVGGNLHCLVKMKY
jgi:hypothetical protein